MLLLYSFGIRIYGLLIKLASLFNSKAKKWSYGRKNFSTELGTKKSLIQDAIWFHCASLGEFEQGRPLIELIRAKYPNQKLILSFYSPSGYEVRKAYSKVDYVFYLPLDTICLLYTSPSPRD